MEYNKSKVSVIVPCYNQAQYIQDALTSVLNQTYQNWECIIVNDGSPDNTEEVALKWCKKDSRLKYLKKDNSGVSDARNFGIKQSQGFYILPLDADDKIGARYLEEAVKILDKDDEIGIVYSDVQLFGDKSDKLNLPDFSVDRILLGNMIVCSALFRKCDYLETIGYNPNMIYGWEDWDFWLSLIENGIKVFKLPEVHFFYRIKVSSSRTQGFEKSIKKRNYLLNTIFLNHIDLYLGEMGNPIEISTRLNQILRSQDYKIGKCLLDPIRRVKKLLINTKPTN